MYTFFLADNTHTHTHTLVLLLLLLLLPEDKELSIGRLLSQA